MKEQRWYEVKDDVLFVYDAPYAEKATACSAVTKDQIGYYRKTFDLKKVWNNRIFL